MALLTEHYADRLAEVLSCFDRIIAAGTLPGVAITLVFAFISSPLINLPRCKGDTLEPPAAALMLSLCIGAQSRRKQCVHVRPGYREATRWLCRKLSPVRWTMVVA
jgi:hypothetical protein